MSTWAVLAEARTAKTKDRKRSSKTAKSVDNEPGLDRPNSCPFRRDV